MKRRKRIDYGSSNIRRLSIKQASVEVGRSAAHTKMLLHYLGYHGDRPCDPNTITTWDSTEVDAVKALLGQPIRKVEAGQVDWLTSYLHLTGKDRTA